MKLESLIFGTLLGDAALMRDKESFRLDISHGAPQLDYLLWKKKRLRHSGKIQPYQTGFDSKAYRIRYYNKALLEKFWDICYENGIKKVTDKWIKNLDDFALALWYQDDGSYTGVGPKSNGIYSERRVSFYTCSFDHESIQNLCCWLESLDMKPRIKIHKKKYEIIQLGDSSTRLLWNRIAPFLVLRHKVDFGIRPNFLQCACGRWIRLIRKPCDICCWEQAKQQNSHTNITRKRKLSLDKRPNYKEPQITWFDHKLLPSQFKATDGLVLPHSRSFI